MKTVISLHSFVDLITNSSSELFICDTKKSVEAVKETIEALAVIYNQRIEIADKTLYGSKISIPGLWTDVFKEPSVAKYNFKLTEFPRYTDWMSMFGHEYNSCWCSDKNQLHPVERDAQSALEDWENDNPRPRWKENQTAEEKKTYDAAYDGWNKSRHVEEEKVYKKWNDMVLDIYGDLYRWVAEVNKINLKPLGELNVHRGRFCNVYFEGKVGENYTKSQKLKSSQFIDEIDEAISWNYTFKKGDIFLRSADDNSIPYELWADIENTFRCQRRHLG